MRRVVPSQVVEYLRRVFPPEIFERAHEEGELFHLQSDRAPALRALLMLIDAIPDELLPPDPERFENLAFAISAIRHRLERWQTNADAAAFRNVSGKNKHAVVLIYNALRELPDETVKAGTLELTYIDDAQLRESIRQDISAAMSALANSEWKAATVLGGAATEALLMWRLQSEPAASLQPIRATLQQENLLRQLNLGLDEWGCRL